MVHYNYYYFYLHRFFLGINRLKMPKYAVVKGKKTGIYDSWDECKNQVTGFKGAKYKKFDTQLAAEDYMKKNGGTDPSNSEEEETVVIDPITKAIQLQANSDAFPIARVSPADNALNNFNKRIKVLESKFNLVTDNINLKFDNILKRLSVLEGRSLVSMEGIQGSGTEPPEIEADEQTSESVPPPKRRKTASDPVDVDISKSIEEAKPAKLEKCNIVDEVDGYSAGWLRHYLPDESGFLISPNGVVMVYTDGACSKNGRTGAKAGIGVWFNHNHPLNVAAPVRGRATNNNAEIQAATEAIKQAAKSGVRRLHIFTDSQFLINCITEWIYKWKRNNWVTIGGHPVKNKEELVELDMVIDSYMDAVIWTYVKGHAGDVGNTQADILARKGAEGYRRF